MSVPTEEGTDQWGADGVPLFYHLWTTCVKYIFFGDIITNLQNIS